MAGDGVPVLPAKPEELTYLNLGQAPDLPRAEGFKDKFLRKTKENPFVPMGLLVTVGALSYGLWQLKTGDRAMSQKMMRLRVAAQGFTILAVMGGVMVSSLKAKKQSGQ